MSETTPFTLPPAPTDLHLQTERLDIRLLTDADVPAMVVYRGDPEVCRYLPFEPQTADDIRGRIGRFFGSTSLVGENAGVVVGAFRRGDGVLVGDLVLFHLDETHGTAEIGWVIRPDLAGQGYATEAARALVDAAFHTFGVRRVVARIDAENAASARLAERLGMRLEAHLVKNEWFGGRWADELDYAILAEEWTG